MVLKKVIKDMIIPQWQVEKELQKFRNFGNTIVDYELKDGYFWDTLIIYYKPS